MGNDKTNSSKKIIKISESLNPTQFDIAHQIQEKAYSRIEELLEEHKSKVEKLEKGNKCDNLHEHNAIFISGNRGCGKTTFLLNIQDRIKEENSSDKKLKDLGKIYVLGMTDPTLLHEKDNFLSVVLGRVKDAIDKKVLEYNRFSENNTDDEDFGVKYKQFINKFTEVASIMDSFEKSKESVGLDNILENQNALSLEKKIHELLKIACKCLNCIFIVLPIDDIDMSFKYGFDVLEKIRKYLATPLILPIISGDFNLYEHIFSSRFFKDLTSDLNLGLDISGKMAKFEEKSQWLSEPDKAKDSTETSEPYRVKDNPEKSTKSNIIGLSGRAFELAELYLAKVLPQNRRISLLGVEDIIHENIDIEFKNGKTKPLNDCIKEVKQIFNLGCGEFAPTLKDPFPKENLRAFIQFLATLEDILMRDETTTTDYKEFFKRISEFYQYRNHAKDIFDFASSNYNAFENDKFSVKKFAQIEQMLKYCKFDETIGIVPYYTKNNIRVNSTYPTSNIDKLFYIITFEKEIKNGTRIFISPDKFFIWLSAKLFSKNDLESSEKIYSFGFDNKLFNYDNNLINLNKNNDSDFLEYEDYDPDETRDLEESPDTYEKIKYAENSMAELLVEEDISSNSFKCSAVLLCSIYNKYRKNVNEILKEQQKYPKNDARIDSFSTFVKRLIYVYMNALAMITIRHRRFSEDHIYVKATDETPLRTKSSTYKWNIERWDEKNISKDEDNLNYIQELLESLLKHLSSGECTFTKINFQRIVNPQNIRFERTSGIENYRRFQQINRAINKIQIEIENLKNSNNPNAIAKNWNIELFDNIEDDLEKILKPYRKIKKPTQKDKNNLIAKINKKIDFEALKKLPRDNRWLGNRKIQLRKEIYDATFGKHFNKDS